MSEAAKNIEWDEDGIGTTHDGFQVRINIGKISGRPLLKVKPPDGDPTFTSRDSVEECTSAAEEIIKTYRGSRL